MKKNLLLTKSHFGKLALGLALAGLLSLQQTRALETELMHYVQQPHARLGTLKSILAQEQGAIDERDAAGNTPFLRLMATSASQGGHKIELAQELIDKGADVTATNNAGKTAVILAVERGDLDLLRFLLNQPAIAQTINMQDEQSKSALFIAVERKSLPMVELLLDRGATGLVAVGSEHMTPLMRAILLGWTEGVERLATRDAVNATDRTGATALFYAVRTLNFDIMQLLISAGVRVSHKDNQGHDAYYYLSRNPAVSPVDIKGKEMGQRKDFQQCSGGGWGCQEEYEVIETCTESEPFCLMKGQCVYRCLEKKTDRKYITTYDYHG